LGKLRVLSGRQVCDILRAHGFAEVRRRGSHIIMQRVVSGGTITVPVPDHMELRIGDITIHHPAVTDSAYSVRIAR